MRYYQPEIKTEVNETSEFFNKKTAVPETDERVKDFFKPLPQGYRLRYNEDNLPIIEPVPKPSAEKILKRSKKSKTNEINTACAKEITNSFNSDALGDTHIYQSEQTDQLNLIGVVTAGQDDYFKCGVTDANGNVTWNYEKHTIAQLQQVLKDGKAVAQTLLQKANTLKQQVAEATTVEDVEAVVW